MRVLHVIPSLSPDEGGPSFAIPMMAKGLRQAGVEVHVATTRAEGELNTADDETCVFSFHRQIALYKVSVPLSSWLSRHLRDYDLVHIHALFSYASYAAANQAMRDRVPYIVRPLGVLNRWGIENRRRLLKRISFRFIERQILQRAAAVHFTSQQERIEAEGLGWSGRSVVLPLGLDLSHFATMPDPSVFLNRFPKAAGRDLILFLSRIDPKKGLDLLIDAFADVHRRHPSALLVVAGAGDEEMVASLKQRAHELGIADEIMWIGFVKAQEKLAALSAASLFVLPSRSENFGIATVEAMAAGLPLVISDQIGIAEDVQSYEAGLVCPCEVAALSNSIRRLLLDRPTARGMAENARKLARERFSLKGMSDSLVQLYRQVIAEESTVWKEAISPTVVGSEKRANF